MCLDGRMSRSVAKNSACGKNKKPGQIYLIGDITDGRTTRAFIIYKCMPISVQTGGVALGSLRGWFSS